jgi:NDP-sugar pyrophosphorylase family protein
MINIAQENLLTYLLTSEFNDIDNPRDYVDLLNLFRSEYRNVYNKNSSLTNENLYLKSEVKNKTEIINEITVKNLIKIANLENDIHQLNKKLNRKLTFKERIKGEIHE